MATLTLRLRARLGRTAPRVLAGSLLLLSISATRAADAAPPSGPHPRLFLNAQRLAGVTANAKSHGTAAASVVAACQDTIDNAGNYTTRGGNDGNNWPGSAVSCAFAYVATKNAAFLAQAIKYWHASLDDDENLGDHLGCVAGVDTHWRSWSGSPPAPPAILTISHDDGYPMRWYGPYIALTYDWLHDAPGVDEGLRAQTRTCLATWVDYYGQKGYHRDQPGANYNAGFVAGKSFAAVAIASEAGADGDRLWNETVNDLFGGLLVGKGLAGLDGAVGKSAGVMVGGDSGEGWQYGPLTVVEYAASALALEENGVPLPAMDTWVDSLAIHYAHATTPNLDGEFPGGDFDDTPIYIPPQSHQLDAVLLGHGSDKAAAYAKYYWQAQHVSSSGDLYAALAETRNVAPVDYRTTSPSLWYVARGTGTVFARTAWDDQAYFGIFSSAGAVNDDHHHPDAGNFALSRGHDHLVVDPSTYGCRSTLPTNGIAADSPGVSGDYAPSQTPWSAASLPWARGAQPGVFAARGDFASAFSFASKPSDIPYAHREWVMLPEGELVTIDRLHTADASHAMHVRFHTNTAGALSISGNTASGLVGSSKLVIHAVELSGGTPSVTKPPVGDCSGPFGSCTNVRFAVDAYAVDVPGPQAAAVHVFDALSASDAAADAVALGDSMLDPSKDNATVIGAAITRAGRRSYVVATRKADGATGATMTYSVPGDASGRHVVFDAPEDATGNSTVTATANGGRCAVSITKGPGIAGRPLMFSVDAASGGCAVLALTDMPPAPLKAGDATPVTVNPDGPTSGGGGAAGAVKGSCGCEVGRRVHWAGGAIGSLLCALTLLRRRRVGP